MNYLAHLFLSPNNDLIRIGNLAGDFIKGMNQSLLPKEMQYGIQLHRTIDKFTDTHPLVIQSKHRIYSPYRRFSGVLIDIFYDHFLARHWHNYSTVHLTEFSHHIYTTLEIHQAILPPKLQYAAPIMKTQDWLNSYQTYSGIEQTLKRMQQRLKYEFPLAEAIDQLEQHHDNLEQDFLCFFPEIREYTNTVVINV